MLTTFHHFFKFFSQTPNCAVHAREKKYPIEGIWKMKDEGLSVRQIAAKIGISKSTIHRLLFRPEE